MDTIRTWLERYQLGHLAEIFECDAIELDILDQLTDEDMKDLGISLGDRYRLKAAIHSLKSSTVHRSKAHFRQLTVLFSDLVDSTRHSVQLDPEEYRKVLRSYQAAVVNIMEKYGGTITRYEGDGILVLFGFPEAHEDDTDRAIRAGLDSVAAVAELQVSDNTELASRVGIATGEVIVGDHIGNEQSRELAVSGSTPNLAARLQGLAGPGTVIISETTHRLITTEIEAVSLEPTRVKGIAEPVQAFVVMDEHESDRFTYHSTRGLTPFIGRDVEHDQLRRAWKIVQENEGQVTVIFGEAGIGKSRLVREFLCEVPRRQVLRYFCLPRYQNTTLHPIMRQLRDAIDASQEVSRETTRTRLARLLNLDESIASTALSVFETMLSDRIDDPEQEMIQLDREQIFTAVSQQLVAFATKSPVVVIIEDLHWADPTTLELLDRMVSWIPQYPIFLIATTRPEFVPAFTESRTVSTIKLMRLTHRDSMCFIDEFRQGKTLSAVDRKRIADQCDGVPLCLEEITRAALDKVDISILERRVTGIPETLRDFLMARLDRLDMGLELAQIASVLGRQFTAHQLRQVADISQQLVEAGLAALENAGVIRARDFVNKPTYQFNHALTADAAYTSMLGETRRQLHAKVAKMLDADPNTIERDPEAAAWHYESAGEIAPAIRAREIAGDRASACSANLEAAYHFNQAVIHATRLPVEQTQPKLELRLRLKLGTQLIACYGNGATQVETNFERAQELCRIVTDEHMRWQTLHGLRSCYLVRGHLKEAQELGTTLLELADRLEDSGFSIQGHRAHGLCLFALGRFDEAREHLERAIELYDPNLHCIQKLGFISDLLVLAKCILGWLHCFRGEKELALRYLDEAIRYAEQLDHQHSLAYAIAISAASHQALGDPECTQLTSQRLIHLSESNSYPYWLAWGRMLSAWAWAHSGDAAALEKFDVGLQAYRETDARMMIAYFLTLRAEIEVKFTRYHEALECLQEAERLTEETGTRFYEGELARLQAVACARISETESTRSALDRARSITLEQGNLLLLQRIDSTRVELTLS